MTSIANLPELDSAREGAPQHAGPAQPLPKRIARRLFPRSLRGTLLSILLVVVLPSVIVEVSLNIARMDVERKQQIQSDMELARFVSATFDAFIQDVLHQEFGLGEALASPQLSGSQQAGDLLAAYDRQVLPVRSLSWLDPGGAVVATSESGAAVLDQSLLPYLQEINAGREWVMSDLYQSQPGGLATFAIMHGKRNQSGTLLGVVVAQVDPQLLGQVLHVRRGGEGAFVLIDRQGKLVYRYPEVDIPWQQRDLIAAQPVVARALTGEEVTDTIVALAGQKRIASYTSVPATGWLASASRTVDEVMAPVIRDAWSEFTMHGLIVLAALALALVMVRRITLPLERLRRYALAVGYGNRRLRIEPDQGLVELSELARACNLMTEEVTAHEEETILASDELRRARDELETRVEGRTAELSRANEILRAEIAERERVEKELLETTQFLEALVKAAPLGISLGGMDHTMKLWNPACERLFGWSAEEVLGRPNPVIPPDKAEEARELTEQAIRSKSSASFDVRRLRKDGSLVDVNLLLAPVRDHNDNIIAIMGMFIDISERRSAEEEREQAQEQLLRAQRLEMAGRVAGQVAHDFNNLLTPLTAYPELIKMELPADHPANELCDSILHSAQQMADINEDLLTLSRRGHFKQEPLDVNDLVQRAVRQMPAANPKLEVKLDLAADLLPVNGSYAQLLRVISNLLANGLEAMDDGGTLRLRTENVYVDETSGGFNRVLLGEYVRLQVTDTGSGISAEVKGRIFDPFFTTKRTDRRRGSGLGLSIVQVIVEDHHGYVDVESEINKGTTFSVYLPVHRGTAAQRSTRVIRGGSETVLIVDDDDLQREVAAQLLTHQGYQAHAVADGEQAVAYLRKHTTDLVILDMIMPGAMDGVETYRQLVEVRPGQRAIIVSGYAESERVSAVQAMGAGAFLRKPVTLEKLAQAVREELDRPR